MHCPTPTHSSPGRKGLSAHFTVMKLQLRDMSIWTNLSLPAGCLGRESPHRGWWYQYSVHKHSQLWGQEGTKQAGRVVLTCLGLRGCQQQR